MELSKIVSPKAKGTSKKNNRKGILTIVQKPGSCKCLVFSVQLAETLGLEDRVILGFLKEEKKIILGKQIPGIIDDGFELKYRMSKGKCIKRVIYSAPLIREIEEIFEMDFSHKTAETLYNLELINENDNIIAIIGR